MDASTGGSPDARHARAAGGENLFENDAAAAAPTEVIHDPVAKPRPAIRASARMLLGSARDGVAGLGAEASRAANRARSTIRARPRARAGRRLALPALLVAAVALAGLVGVFSSDSGGGGGEGPTATVNSAREAPNAAGHERGNSHGDTRGSDDAPGAHAPQAQHGNRDRHEERESDPRRGEPRGGGADASAEPPPELAMDPAPAPTAVASQPAPVEPAAPVAPPPATAPAPPPPPPAADTGSSTGGGASDEFSFEAG